MTLGQSERRGQPYVHLGAKPNAERNVLAGSSRGLHQDHRRRTSSTLTSPTASGLRGLAPAIPSDWMA